jgi:F-type H+-transporting ATPase subunit gamma
MPSLKDMRSRISSVKATQKITKAMQMVAAAKLRRAQDAANAARPYAERMRDVLAKLNAEVAGQDMASPLQVGTGSDQVHLLVVATAERGLCGGFNASIVRRARETIRALLADGKEVKILCVGRKGYDLLRRDHAKRIVDLIEFKGVARLGFEHALGIGKRVLKMFDDGEFDVCTLIYSEFESILVQKPRALQLIPVELPKETDQPARGASPSAVYEYEPEEEEILRDLLPRNIYTQIFRALLENAAGEQGARMTAMDNATRNAGELIKKLTLSYNRMRQDMITKELIEIVSGAEAL